MSNDDLRTLAERATPGPWTHAGRGNGYIHGPEGNTVADMRYKNGAADAAYIAAANPQAILALLDELDAIEAARLRNAQDAHSAWRRVAALEEGLRSLVRATDEIVWCVVCDEEARSLADEARALLDPVEADYQRFLHPDPAAPHPRTYSLVGSPRLFLVTDDESGINIGYADKIGGPLTKAAAPAPPRCDRIVNNRMGVPTECGRALPCELHDPAALPADAALAEAAHNRSEATDE